MSACAQLTYSNVTPAVWQCIVNAANKYVPIPPTEYSGCASASDFTVCWNYSPQTQILSVQCTDSPWWATCGLINSTINGVIEPCMTELSLSTGKLVNV